MENKTLVLKDNINGYRYGIGNIANPSKGECSNAYYIDSRAKAVTFTIDGPCFPVE